MMLRHLLPRHDAASCRAADTCFVSFALLIFHYAGHYFHYAIVLIRL